MTLVQGNWDNSGIIVGLHARLVQHNGGRMSEYTGLTTYTSRGIIYSIKQLNMSNLKRNYITHIPVIEFSGCWAGR